MTRAYIVGTLDTKGEELLYIRDLLAAEGVQACVVDVGTGSGARPTGVDVSAAEVAAHHPDGADAVLALDDRGQAVAAMGEALARFLPTCADIGGVIGAGGSGNTALVSIGMQALPIGVPRVLVSTVASGNVAPYVGPNDITMMYSVVDVAGLNRISPRGARQRGACARRHDAGRGAGGPGQARHRPDHVRRHHALRRSGPRRA